MQIFEELFDPQQQQQLQQQKLLEFHQRSQRKQVEQVLPMDDESNSTQSSASYIGQRLLELKQIQQKQHYEHQLQQQYENRSIIEEAYANDSIEQSLDLHENEMTKDDLYELHYSHNISKILAISPECLPNDLKCVENVDFDNSIRLTNNLSIRNEEDMEINKFHKPISMPIVEDGLSSEHESDWENNNVDSHSGNELTTVTDEVSSCDTPNAHQSCEKIREELKSDSSFEHGVVQEKHPKLPHSLNQPPSVVEDNNNIYASKESLASTNITELKPKTDDDEADTDLETDRLLGEQRRLELQQDLLGSNQVNINKIFLLITST